ncbi:cytochrome c [Hydrotalea sp.]|uniref:c-type cytochrome n=1 Tax=Hydrotalea sp. TaxID=2881279 RepID=UPI00262F042D|nr:cytochrome c [Hydrotalea sp.]
MKNLLKCKPLTKSVFIGIVFFAICLVLASFSPKQSEWKAPESAKNIKNPIPANAVSLAAGKTIYIKECLQCHGKNGLGNGPKSADLDKAPESFNTPKVKNQTDGELFWKIKEGRKPMPSTKKSLTDEQRWQVVNYIRTLGK